MTLSNISNTATCSEACHETAIRQEYEYGMVITLVERRIGARSGRASKLVALMNWTLGGLTLRARGGEKGRVCLLCFTKRTQRLLHEPYLII
jgi:hypothetical protein